MDDDMKAEVEDTLGKPIKRKKVSENEEQARKEEEEGDIGANRTFAHHDDAGSKRHTKEN